MVVKKCAQNHHEFDSLLDSRLLDQNAKLSCPKSLVGPSQFGKPFRVN